MTVTWADGTKYVGGWKRGAWHGQGTRTYGSKSKLAGAKYVGEYRDHKKHGQGTFTWADGSKYVGEWMGGQRNRQGTYTTSNHKYIGQWEDDKKHGQGTLTSANGTVKEGIWENDKFLYAKKLSPTVTAKKIATYNPEHLKRFKETGKCPKCNLQGADLRGVYRQHADLRGANLQGADLRYANLRAGYLDRTNLQGASLQKANLGWVSLYQANLQGAKFQDTNLFRANFFMAILYETNLKGAILTDTRFEKANLQGTDLRFAKLQRAYLKGANLKGANLKGANLKGANLRYAKLDPEGIKIAKASGAINIPELVIIFNKTPTKGSSLPPCSDSPANDFHIIRYWTDCVGTINFANGAKYDGKFKEGKYNGQGTINFANGAKYDGKFKEGKYNGQGTINFANGIKYEGEWNDGLWGRGTITFADGGVLKGAWEGTSFKYNWIAAAEIISQNLLQSALSEIIDLRPPIKEDPSIFKTRYAGITGKHVGYDPANSVFLYEFTNQQGNKVKIKIPEPPKNIEEFLRLHGSYDDVLGRLFAKKSSAVDPPKTKEPKTTVRKTPKSNVKPKPVAQSISASGFFVSRLGHVITNAHVVKGCKRITLGDNANQQTTVELVSTDKKNDLALLKLASSEKETEGSRSLIERLGIDVRPRAFHGLLRSDEVVLGEKLMVAGYPYGDVISSSIKITYGNVNSVRGVGDNEGEFQHDAAVQKGSSGGPIYDENGNIVGVVVSRLDKMKFNKNLGSFPENMNFGIKASTVRQFLDESGLPIKLSSRSHTMSNEELTNIAQKQTLMVVCHQ